MIWNLKKWADNIAIECGDKQYNYSKLIEDTDNLAKSVGKRTVVFIVTSNTYASVMGYVACLNNDIVPLMLDATIDEKLFIKLYQIYRPSFIWKPYDFACSVGGDEIKKFEYDGYVLIRAKSDLEDIKMSDDLALLISTSGSTGSPKLIRQSYHNIKSNMEAIIEYLKINESEIAITSLPMNYVYGLSVINSHIAAGARIILTELTPYSKKFWDLFDAKCATSFAGVPYMYEMLDNLKFTKKDGRHPSLKTMTQAGGKLLPELHEKFANYAIRNGIDFVVMYGAAEATSRMGYLPASKAFSKKGSMGISIPGGSFRLIDEDENEIEESYITGELLYEGENVALGYAECRDDLAKGDENGGVLRTGDLAYRDEDGYYYVVGRKKRFIKILGNRIGLDQVERILKEKFKVIELACTGKDDKLVVCLGCDLDENSIIMYVFETLHINQKMIKVIRIDEIPKNASGKIQYSKLLKYVT